MDLTVKVYPRLRVPRRCCGCGDDVISYNDHVRGYGHEGDEVGERCCLCRKIACWRCGCAWAANMIHVHNVFAEEYSAFVVRLLNHGGEIVCSRCVAKFEMSLIRKIGYEELPLYMHLTWMTGAAVKYFEGMLQGRYT